MIRVTRLQVENQIKLFGTDILRPRLSWLIQSDKPGVTQTAYQIRVYKVGTDYSNTLVWDTQMIHSIESTNIEYEGPSLESRAVYCWNVRVWLLDGTVTDWSDEGQWEMGLLEETDWQANWIKPYQLPVTEEPELTLEDMFINKKINDQLPVEQRLHAPKLVRKTFLLEKKNVTKARLYITAHGLYQAKINGQKVTDAEFTPDYTSYSHYLQYQTYDVLPLLEKGENVLGVTLADGWYAGRISIPGGSAQFGNTLGLLAQLEVEYDDQTKQVIGTDSSYVSSNSHYVYSDLFIGEKQNKNLEKRGWDRPGYQLQPDEWTPVNMVDDSLDNLRAQYGESVKRIQELTPKRIWKDSNGAYLIDFGQVLAGRIRLKVKAAYKGQEVKIEHSEVLNEKGEFFSNIVGRNKEQTDYYVASGSDDEVFEPTFTYHGFRYVRISGYNRELVEEDIRAIVLHTDMRETGYFSTSNKDINQLWNNIRWSQKGNMLSIPTDCPQREKAGWTGDLQVFAPTAAYNMDVQAFLTRWLWNLQLEQTSEGEVLNYCPAPKDIWNDKKFTGTISSAGWGDAIILVPAVLYERYGDVRILEQCYPSMVRWLDYVQMSASEHKEGKEDNKYLWDTKFHYGDWMIPSFMLGENPQGPIATALQTKDVMATAFYAHSARLLSTIAGILGKQADQARYQELHLQVKEAFVRAYVQESGLLSADFQGTYTIALAFCLLDGKHKAKAVSRLVELIEKNNFRLDTGFLSVPYIMDVLCDHGHQEIAYQLLFQTQCPSWLYEVKNGATTIWESWEAIKPDGTVGSFSFNHYAFGCVGDWLVRHIGGLTALEPGFRTFRVEPHASEQLREANLSYQSVYGPIAVSWELRGNDEMFMRVLVPCNTTAVICLTEVNPATAPSFVQKLREQGYVDALHLEDQNRIEFTASPGITEVKWVILPTSLLLKK